MAAKNTQRNLTCPHCGQEVVAEVTVPQTGPGDAGIMVSFKNRCEHLAFDGMSYSYNAYECPLEQAIRGCFSLEVVNVPVS